MGEGAPQVVLQLEPIAVTREQAAAALGMSLDAFEQRVQPFVRLLPNGRRRLVPVAELRRYVEEHVELPIADALTRSTQGGKQ